LRFDIGIELRAAARRACGRPRWSAATAGSASGASAAIRTSKPLRGTTAPTESSRTMPSLLPRPCAAIGARTGDRDELGGTS
jgi:hypothetical protein